MKAFPKDAAILILSHPIFTLGGVAMLSVCRVKSYEDVAAATTFRFASKCYVHVNSNSQLYFVIYGFMLVPKEKYE